MQKGKIPIIICLLLMLSLTGYLILSKTKPDRANRPVNSDHGLASASTVSPGAITTKDNFDNNTYIPPSLEYDGNNNNKYEDQMSTNDSNKAPWAPATEMDLEPTSLTVYVNKEYGLPKDYVPENLVVPNITFDISGESERKLMREDAAKAIESLFNVALDEGYTLYGVSGYRSYSRQKDIFINNIVTKGKNHTLKYSAAPGTSEHQTGLAMDVSSRSIRYRLVTAFASCAEGKWLADHAHEFGFIIRYPKDRSSITGYAYEPWHIRYVGKDLANYLYTNKMTLDEYYNYVPSEGFDYEKKYAALINYVPPATPTPTPTPTPVPALGLDLDGDGILDVFVGDDLDGDGIPDVILGDDLDGDGIQDVVFREDFDLELISEYLSDEDHISEEDEDLHEDQMSEEDEDDITDEDLDDDHMPEDNPDEDGLQDDMQDDDFGEDGLQGENHENPNSDHTLDEDSDETIDKDNTSDNIPSPPPINIEEDYIN